MGWGGIHGSLKVAILVLNSSICVLDSIQSHGPTIKDQEHVMRFSLYFAEFLKFVLSFLVFSLSKMANTVK